MAHRRQQVSHPAQVREPGVGFDEAQQLLDAIDLALSEVQVAILTVQAEQRVVVEFHDKGS
jgi:hypothetical protein